MPGVVYIQLESKPPSCQESYKYDWDFLGCPCEPAALCRIVNKLILVSQVTSMMCLHAKTQLFDDFDTDFDSGSDNSDDNNLRELVPLLNNI